MANDPNIIDNNTDEHRGRAIPSDQNYTGWHWKEVSAALTGSGGIALEDRADRSGLADPNSLYQAAQNTAQIQNGYVALMNDLVEASNLVFTKWSGKGAKAFEGVVKNIHGRLDTQYRQLAGQGGGGDGPIPTHIHRLGIQLDVAQQVFDQMDSHYANQASLSGAPTVDGLVHISHTKEVDDMFSKQAGEMMQLVADRYATESAPIKATVVDNPNAGFTGADQGESEFPTQEFPTQEFPTQEFPTQEFPTQEFPTQEFPTQEFPTQDDPPETGDFDGGDPSSFPGGADGTGGADPSAFPGGTGGADPTAFAGGTDGADPSAFPGGTGSGGGTGDLPGADGAPAPFSANTAGLPGGSAGSVGGGTAGTPASFDGADTPTSLSRAAVPGIDAPAAFAGAPVTPFDTAGAGADGVARVDGAGGSPTPFGVGAVDGLGGLGGVGGPVLGPDGQPIPGLTRGPNGTVLDKFGRPVQGFGVDGKGFLTKGGAPASSSDISALGDRVGAEPFGGAVGAVLDADGNPIAGLSRTADGRVLDANGNVIDGARVDANGNLIDANGNPLDAREIESFRAQAFPHGGAAIGPVLDADGNPIPGLTRTADGQVLDANGNIIDGARVDANGRLIDANGNPLDANAIDDFRAQAFPGAVLDADGNPIPGLTRTADGQVLDANGNVIDGARVDANGRLIDANGNPLDAREIAPFQAQAFSGLSDLTPDGRTLLPSGFSVDPDGGIYGPDGELIPGATMRPDGTIVGADGYPLAGFSPTAFGRDDRDRKAFGGGVDPFESTFEPTPFESTTGGGVGGAGGAAGGGPGGFSPKPFDFAGVDLGGAGTPTGLRSALVESPAGFGAGGGGLGSSLSGGGTAGGSVGSAGGYGGGFATTGAAGGAASGAAGGAGAAGAGGMPMGMPMGGRGAGGQGGEGGRDRSTWLKEEDDVWSSDSSAAPDVIA